LVYPLKLERGSSYKFEEQESSNDEISPLDYDSIDIESLASPHGESDQMELADQGNTPCYIQFPVEI
jgi:hypothetical protein